MAWEYKREEQKFQVLPEGTYRVRIADADKAVSQNGNDMLNIKLEVSGSNSLLFHHIVFLNDRPEITNRMLTQFFDSFKDIPEGDFNMANWIGKVGACTVKHQEYKGETRASVGYFIAANKQGDLPPWKEPSNSGGAKKPTVEVDADGFAKMPPSGEIPFF